MKINAPLWIKSYTDDHMKVFLWFCHRMATQHGFNTWYGLHTDDIVRMCNKRNKGLVEWLRETTAHSKRIEFGQTHNLEIVFLVKPIVRERRAGRPHAEKLHPTVITDPRAQMVYMYLLGCLNNNLLGDHSFDMTRFQTNSFGQKEFLITREAQGYIKKQDRKLE